MKSFRDKTAVVTGAGSGIGRALAQQLAKLGCRLVIADVNAATLEDTRRSLGTAACAAFTLDVSDRSAMQAFKTSAIAAFGSVDIVVNNAGVGLYGSVDDSSYEDIEWLFGINFWGVVHGTKEFLPHLLSRPEASLVNVASLAAIVGMPNVAAYSASKFAVRGFTEALRQEVIDTGLAVTCVHPGGVRTEIARGARFGAISAAERDAQIAAYTKLLITSPEKCAAAIVRGIRRKSARVMVGIDAQVVERLQRALPVRYQAVLALTVKQ